MYFPSCILWFVGFPHRASLATLLQNGRSCFSPRQGLQINSASNVRIIYAIFFHIFNSALRRVALCVRPAAWVE
jgi:hypothetical protein